MSDFNTLPEEPSPELSDEVFTGRGGLAGAERKPTLQSIMSLFSANGGGLSAASMKSGYVFFSNITPGPNILALPAIVPAGNYIVIGSLLFGGDIGDPVSIDTAFVGLQPLDASDNPINEIAYVFQINPVTLVTGPFSVQGISPFPIELTSDMAKWQFILGGAPSAGTLQAQTQILFVPIIGA